MTKFILSGGYYHKSLDQGDVFCKEIIKGISSNPIKILDCLFGRAQETWEQKINDDAIFFLKHGVNFTLEIAIPNDFTEQVKNSDIIFFQGSRPEDMIEILNTVNGWQEALKGKTIVASSGGASVLCKYFGTGKSSSGSPRLGEGLGILPIKLIPHWKSDHGIGFTANWDDLYQRLFMYKEKLELLTLADGEFKVILAE